MRIASTLTFLLLVLCWSPAAAQSGDEQPWAPLIRPEVFLERSAGAIRIDGRLDDEGWQSARHIDHFSELQPGEGVRPPVHTEVWMTYDEEFLYVAFKAHDDPKQVRASLRNRDEIFQDDWVGIILDPYGDATRAYEIFANPLGVQGDLLMSRSGENPGFDLIYHTAGRVTDEGYVVEMAIPFRSLRFPPGDVHEWRITFLRNYPRSSRHLFTWAGVRRNESCFLCQLGYLRGIEGVRSGGSLEALPALVGSQASTLPDEAGALEHGRVSVEPSLTLRYNVSSSVAAEATFNPDFSQIESDASQIDVNTPFALYYPERRPFFQEGSEMFETMIDVVYTRSINSPLAAVKLTGQPGRTSFGVISAVDERSPLLLPFGDRSALVEAGRSVVNVVRGRHTFGTNSFVGGVISDRRFAIGGSGTEVALDAQWQLTETIRLSGQAVRSHTEEPDDPERYESDRTFGSAGHTAVLDGERFSGHAALLQAARSGRTFNFQTTYVEFAPTFRASSGFVSRNDYRRLRANPSVTLYPKGGIEQVRVGGFVGRQWAFDGSVLRQEQEVSTSARLKRQTNVYASVMLADETFRGVGFSGLWWVNTEISSQPNEVFSLGFYHGTGRTIARFADEPTTGQAREISAWTTVKPLHRLVIQPRFQYAEMTAPAADEPLYRGFIARTRVDLLFSREASLRLVVEYNDFADVFSIEPLLSYRMNAYSMVYLGATHRLEEAGPMPGGYRTASRQFFFKMQYLIRG